MTDKRPLAKRVVDRVVDGFRAGFLWLTAWMPLSWRSGLAGWFARQMVRVIPGARRRMEAGIMTAFPDMGAAERDALVAATARGMGRTQIEIFLSRDLVRLVDDFAVEGPGLAAIEASAAEGKGAVLVSGHFGQWEAVRLFLKARGLETGAIYRRFTSPHYERAFRRAFGFAGRPVFRRGPKGTRKMVRHIRSGGRIAILADQAQKTAPVLRFFGRPAHSSLAAAELALKYKLPLVPVYGVRGRDDPMRFTVIFEAPIEHSDATTMTQAINDSLEAMVRKYPEQWFWVHRRWKLAPDVARSGSSAGRV